MPDISRSRFFSLVGAPKRNALINILRGNAIRDVSNSLPEEIDLLVYA